MERTFSSTRICLLHTRLRNRTSHLSFFRVNYLLYFEFCPLVYFKIETNIFIRKIRFSRSSSLVNLGLFVNHFIYQHRNFSQNNFNSIPTIFANKNILKTQNNYYEYFPEIIVKTFQQTQFRNKNNWFNFIQSYKFQVKFSVYLLIYE